MARFPCTRCKSIYRGPQQTAYPAVVTKNLTYSERLRLCPDCFHQVTTDPAWSLADAEDFGSDIPCGICGAAQTPVALFCTFYARGEERADLYGRLCNDDCVAKFLERVWGTVEGLERALKVG
jgi:hypothetical protein